MGRAEQLYAYQFEAGERAEEAAAIAAESMAEPSAEIVEAPGAKPEAVEELSTPLAALVRAGLERVAEKSDRKINVNKHHTFFMGALDRSRKPKDQAGS